MAEDEFGRKIPMGRGPRSPGHYGHHHHPDDPPPASSYLNGALPTSRHHDETRGVPPPPLSSTSSYPPGGGSGGNTSGHRHQYHHQYRGDTVPYDQDNRSTRKRKQRDYSPGHSTTRRSGTGSGYHNHHNHHHKDHNSGSSNKTPHPYTLYADEPMLCQVVWKEKGGTNGDDNAVDDDNQGYDDYRKNYCLNYIRTFFNQHMDDSWFRSRYSPLEQHRVALQERHRARTEAQAYMEELKSSLEKQTPGESSKCFFILKARLGGGTKQSNSSSSHSHHHDYSSSPGKLSSSSLINPIPATHLLSLSRHVLPIPDVPPHVSDQQLISALIHHVTGLKRSDLQVYSSSVAGNGNLFRTAYIHCIADSVRKEILQQLNHTTTTMTSTSTTMADGPAVPSHVPRKEDTSYIPHTLELEVECSDAYGRLEVDTDGKGGDGGGGDEDAVAVTPRKATVWISTAPTQTTLLPKIAVLSAAVSSKVHCSKDCEAALTLCKAYDVRNDIPLTLGFQSILKVAMPNFSLETSDDQDVEDTLDLAVAYLRRVHLVSFYNGCASTGKAATSRVADVWNGNHPAATIHLRLGGADDMLKEAAKDDQNPPSSDEPLKVDLLVQRHTTSIEKALKEAHAWLEEGDKWQKVVVCPEVDSAAHRIERDEAQVEPGWLRDHSVIDEDGRARCSFHFCRKLFKDSTFLKKHLLKKHSEFLKSERAKCHDQSMMKAWDAQEHRPVPPIMVDCGRVYSLVPSPVVGADVPLADDPEPELWRREEERREEEERMRKEREERFEPPDPNATTVVPTFDRMTSAPRRVQHFVDVDDMKEEKIDLAFDDVALPIQPPKKKKKKKLL